MEFECQHSECGSICDRLIRANRGIWDDPIIYTIPKDCKKKNIYTLSATFSLREIAAYYGVPVWVIAAKISRTIDPQKVIEAENMIKWDRKSHSETARQLGVKQHTLTALASRLGWPSESKGGRPKKVNA